ncbi:uncharacterized protein LOC113279448 [Papaver somniferum]|uniref:uncharacterized protein LOC113279448 n=1 Tax=Papaver somniferum TaxID=3469 RepID=UPI000E6FA85E|nr:uncharacterized protein LOC113279448 [Papaver somniferum]
METVMRQFLWGIVNNKAKRGWVGFKRLKLPKEGGGVGIKKLRLMNKSLHVKWIWRYGNEENALWRKVVNRKFGGNEKDFLTNQTTKPIGRSLWAGILKSRDQVEMNTTIHELKDEEIEDVAHLMDLISIFRRGDAEDYRVWQNGNKPFSLKECYKDLEIHGLIYFPYKCVWNPKIPQKVVFFVWNLCFVAAPTMDTYKNSIMVNGCLLCKKAAKTNHHVFLHCETTRELWCFFLSGYSLQWVFQESVRDTIWEWKRKKGSQGSLKQRIWDIIPFAFWWAVWLERNVRVFNGKYKTLEESKDVVKILIFNWCTGTNIFEGISLNTVINNWGW